MHKDFLLIIYKQKQQLGFKQDPIPESKAWLDTLDKEIPEVEVEQQSFEIAKMCERARNTLKEINNTGLQPDAVSALIKDMHTLDTKTLTWRKGVNWSFKTVPSTKVARVEELPEHFPASIQLHRDIWIAYEWNYHRTARIVLHEQLLECIDRVYLGTTEDIQDEFEFLRKVSVSIIRDLVDEILSTVPQSLGDIDGEGNLVDSTIPPKSRGVAAYFLLWPIKIIKSTKSATSKQREAGMFIFERIREYTGMKSILGDLSCI
jgi:hypothetical protein